MHIKRFEAATMLEAVRKVKEELGPDALVLSTRTLKKHGGVFGLMARSVVEVTAAIDRDVRRADRPGTERVRSDASWQELRMTRALVDPLEHELREVRRLVERLALTQVGGDDLARDLGELRRTTGDLARRWLPGAREPCEARHSGRLLEAGLAARHAFALGEEAARSGAVGGEALRDLLARRMDDRLKPPRDDDPGRIELFVGPTGVGKTTTLAKIAARGRDGGDGISVVTTDTHRIGAEDHLRTFAELLDVPFGVAVSADDLGDRVRAWRGRRVLVDTAGRNRCDPASIDELCQLRKGLGSEARVHLVLSATTKDADLRRELDCYRPLRPDSLIVTKLDESEDFGNVANLLLDEGGPPLAWLTTGQRVPEDLAVPDPREIADRILGDTA